MNEFLSNISLLFLDDWNIDNTIQSLIFVTTATSVILLYKTLIAGQKQARETNELTRQNLSISQYQIYMEEIKSFFEVFQSQKFNLDFEFTQDEDYESDINSSDGIRYMWVFRTLLNPGSFFYTKDKTPILDRVNDFRREVLFPLFRNYSELSNFLNRIFKDQILKEEHKGIIYLILERDMLQSYFRLCNNETPDSKKSYDLTVFETQVFQSKSLYTVNQFYIDNNLFSLHSLQFYKETL